MLSNITSDSSPHLVSPKPPAHSFLWDICEACLYETLQPKAPELSDGSVCPMLRYCRERVLHISFLSLTILPLLKHTSECTESFWRASDAVLSISCRSEHS